MTELTLTVSPEERAAGRLHPEHHRTAALLLHTAGCVVLRNLLPPELVERVNAAFNRVFEDCVESKRGESWYQVSARNQAVFWERAARWRVFPKLRSPFDDVSLLANPLIVPLFEELLGDDFFCKFVSSDTCLRGSLTQAPHRELSAGGATTPCAYIVNVPLMMCGLENGPIEVWPMGTHLWQPDLLNRYQLSDDTQDGENQSMEQFARLFPSQKLALEPGSVLIRDPGMLHRGTPNPTDTPRTMLTICYLRRGHEHDYGDIRFNLDEAIYEKLAPAAKRVFAGTLGERKTPEDFQAPPPRLSMWPWRQRKR
jgi:ectoine hydroxylase-related dioxygenase (phytanoyl-CoA dioxygenase family)